MKVEFAIGVWVSLAQNLKNGDRPLFPGLLTLAALLHKANNP